MSTEVWTIQKDLCRCCHAEGTFRNLAEPCFSSGSEIYADMLRNIFDINMVPVPGLLCAMTYTICGACVQALESASSFRKRAEACEAKFKDFFKRNLIKVADKTVDITVKEELPDSCNDDDLSLTEDNNFDELPEFGYDEEENKADPEEMVKKKIKKLPLKPKKDKSKAKKKVGRPKKMKEEPIGDEEADKRKGLRRGSYYTIKQNRYSCNDCERTFASQPLMSQHYRFVHLKRRPRSRKCPKCDEKIPGHLRAYHLDKKHGIPAPSCGVCGKKFRFPCNVLRHQKKVHMGEKTAVCDICQKSFFDKLSLRLHMLTHSSEKRYKCETCTREFRWENNLKDHMKIHTGDRRFVCQICDKTFVQKTTLKQHTARNHPGMEALI